MAARAIRLLDCDGINAGIGEAEQGVLVFAFEVAKQTSQRERANRTLNEADAVEIWIARWLRVPRKSLIARYGCDPRRLYEIWWGERFPGSREQAMQLFEARYPGLADRVHFGYRRIPRKVACNGQLELLA